MEVERFSFAPKKRFCGNSNQTNKAHLCLFLRLFYSPYQSKAARAGDLRLSCGNGNFVAGKLKSNTGGVRFYWCGIQNAMLYSQKYTPPHCFLSVELIKKHIYCWTSSLFVSSSDVFSLPSPFVTVGVDIFFFRSRSAWIICIARKTFITHNLTQTLTGTASLQASL